MKRKTSPLASEWKKFFDLWNSAHVPDVEVVPFEYSDPYHIAWRRRDEPNRICDSNPLRSTAYHLATYLTDKPLELSAAYKLHAYCLNFDLYPDKSLLHHAFSSNQSELYGWWGVNSRHVLPPVRETPGGRYSTELSNSKDWNQIVPAAAREWRHISEQWVIVRIPELMPHGSDELAKWENHCKKASDERERLEYERLKKKFGDD